ncbi:hypothetical protein [Fusibacter tunisiensis]|uniref:hypothetical protein n=1 Tax=Fusibacter tunisiensis TaxID=1008308 RepID=UPI0019589C37|nr:hypothetical protein [Fusibacter tunisiensis]
MLRKLGCSQEGIRKQQIFTNGHYNDQIPMKVLVTSHLEPNLVQDGYERFMGFKS